MEKKKLPWEGILLFLLLALLLWQGWQVKLLSDTVDRLENRLEDRVEFALNRLYNSEERLAAEIKALEDPIADHTLTPVGVDQDTRSVLMDVSVTLKEMQADTVVLLDIRSGEGEKCEIALSGDMTGKFVTKEPVHLPLDAEAVWLSATVVRNGVHKTQELEAAQPHLFLPIRQSGMGWGGKYSYKAGTFFMIDAPCVNLEDREYQPARVSEGTFHIYQNGTEVFTVGARLPEEEPLIAYEPSGWVENFPAAEGDTFRLTFSCRDENGLGYEFTLHKQEILADGQVKNAEIEADGGLRLFW